MKLHLYRSTARTTKGQFGWKLIAKNNRSLAVGGELYKRRGKMIEALGQVFDGYIINTAFGVMRNTWNQEVEIVDETKPAARSNP